jgi:hypothetical protein
MIEIPFFCTDAGSILITGFESQLQGPIGRQLVAEHLMAGGRAAIMVDSESDGREAAGQMSDMVRAMDVNPKVLDRFVIVPNVKSYRDAEALQFAIDKRSTAKGPLLIVRPLAGEMTELHADDPWLPLAEELALVMNARVLTVAHYGRSGLPAPVLANFPADEVWDCKAGLNLSVVLTRHVPSPLTVTLEGAVTAYGQITFMNMENAHAFA